MNPVTDRRKAVTEVLSVNRQFGRSTAHALEELLTPELEDGKPLPDLVYVQQLMTAALECRWHRLSTADEACCDAQADRQALIGERDDEVSRLYREIADLRTVLRGRFGAEPSKRFIGLSGDTSRDPVVILRQGDRAVVRLRDPDRPLPASKLRPSLARRARWATFVAEAADALRATVARVVSAVKQLDAARFERQRALDDFNDVFVRVAGWFEATYRVIGRDDLAQAVRPSRRHPGKTYLQVKQAAKPAAERGNKADSRPSVVTQLIAPLRQIFDFRRSA